MRVLLVNDRPPGPTGGAEMHVGRLRDGLRAAGDEVEVFAPGRPRQRLTRALDLWDPNMRRRLRTILDRFGPDVIHYHNVLDELSTSVVGISPASVLTVHDPRVIGIRYGLDQDRSVLVPIVAAREAKNRLARHRLRRNVAATVVPSAALATAVAAAGFPAVRHIPNFAPAAPLTPPGTDILFVGTLSAHKGPDLALRAFRQIASHHPGVRLRLVGEGPMAASLRADAEPSLSDRVVFEGRRSPDDVAELLQSAAFVVAPSLGVEGGGPTLVVIEAMSSGRPVIVSDRPGVSEGVDDEVGAVVPAEVAALADAMDAFLSDRGRLAERGAAAHRRAATRWSTETIIPQLKAVYEEVAGART